MTPPNSNPPDPKSRGGRGLPVGNGASDPQQQADRLRVFQEELTEAERAGAFELSSEQRDRVHAYIAGRMTELAAAHDVDTTAGQSQVSLGMKLASALGGLALCAAVVLFFQRFLGYWPTPVQVIVLAALPIALTLLAEWTAHRERTLYYTSLISLVAFAAFVTNIAVLGATFNMAPTPNALLAWGAFGVALAYHFGLRLVLAAAISSLLAWVVAGIDYWRGWWWLDFDQKPEDLMLAGVACFFLPMAIRHSRRYEFPAVFRMMGMLAAFLPMLFLAGTGESRYLDWTREDVQFFYQVLGMAATVGVIWLGVLRGWSGAVNTGTAFFLLFLLFRLVDWLWDWMPSYVFFLLIGGVAIALVAVFKRLRSRMRERESSPPLEGSEAAG